MWIVAKVKRKEFNIFKQKLVEEFGKDTQFYHPKLQYQRYIKNKIKKFEKLILENYVFCYHEKFNSPDCINSVRFLKGLEYFLDGYIQNQNEMIKFINFCKSCENEAGYLTQAFFKTTLFKNAQFIAGPFTNMFFQILKKQKNKLTILIGDVVTTISNKGELLYRPV